jgi:hypothetical protein
MVTTTDLPVNTDPDTLVARGAGAIVLVKVTAVAVELFTV